MLTQETLFSPKQVAEALGVSESSVKRWCDKGMISTARSGGGHRRMRRADVVAFIRRSGHNLVAPESLGLQQVDFQPKQIESAINPCVETLLTGDEHKFQEILKGLYLSSHRLSEIFDSVLAPVFHEIGIRWECDDAEVYQERRSCEVCIQSLTGIREMQTRPFNGATAIGGTLPGDIYQIPATMAELVLRDQGIDAKLLGNSIPADSFLAAIDDLKPNLVWLSISHIRDETEFVKGFQLISDRCVAKKIGLVVGGRALTSELRRKVTYSAFCDTMKHLESFAATLTRSNSANAVNSNSAYANSAETQSAKINSMGSTSSNSSSANPSSNTFESN